MEVKNPLFRGDDTPAAPQHVAGGNPEPNGHAGVHGAAQAH